MGISIVIGDFGHFLLSDQHADYPASLVKYAFLLVFYGNLKSTRYSTVVELYVIKSSTRIRQQQETRGPSSG